MSDKIKDDELLFDEEDDGLLDWDDEIDDGNDFPVFPADGGLPQSRPPRAS